jgi:carboxyl-terminal processing protease
MKKVLCLGIKLNLQITKSLSKDIYIEEAIHVLDDLQSGNTKKAVTSKLKKDKILKS